MKESSFKKTVSKIALIYAVMQIAVVGFQYALTFILLKNFNKADILRYEMYLSTMPLYIIGLPIALFLFKKLPDSGLPKYTTHLTFKVFFRLFCLSYAFFYAGGLISNILTGILSFIMGRPVFDPVSAVITESSTLSIFITSVIIAPIGEEFLFRYLPYKKLSKYGDMFYILSTSLMFALFHMNFFQFCYTFTAGLVFSYVYSHTELLRYNIIMHMLINFMGAIAAPYIAVSGGSGLIFGIAIVFMILVGLNALWKHSNEVVFSIPAEDTGLHPIADIFFNIGMGVFLLLFFAVSIYNL